jgi:hypothetical protein
MPYALLPCALMPFFRATSDGRRATKSLDEFGNLVYFEITSAGSAQLGIFLQTPPDNRLQVTEIVLLNLI